MKKILPVLALSFLLCGCATIVSGTEQSVMIQTPMVDGAKCSLTDSKNGRWYLESTPGAVTVQKGNGPMHVVCKKKGYHTGITSADDEFAGATLGNVILGGGVGVFVDAVSGAAQEYPDTITVWMKPDRWTSSSARKEWERAKADYDAAQKAKAEQAQKNRQSVNQ